MSELAFMLRSRLVLWAGILLLALSALSLWNGARLVEAHRAAQGRIETAHAQEFAEMRSRYGRDGADPGYAAYYTFHLAPNPLPPLAFAALGQRDLQPAALRVRMLGLHSQLYESENLNPDLAALGSFDFAFVVVYLLPLCAIALMYDWAAGERESGRLRLLQAMPMRPARLFGQRAWLRFAWLSLALTLPLLVAGAWHGAPLLALLAMAAVSLLYLAFWCGLALVVGARLGRAHAAALALLGMLLVLVLLVPAAVNLAMTRVLPAGQGARLALEQREVVHRGWDLPKQATFAQFFGTHPEWRDTAPVTGRFHWKWYYAMQQVGDQAVAPQVTAYRKQLQARQRWASLAGWLDPAVAVHVALHRLSDTDLPATLRYWDAITGFHRSLRQYHYPFLFNERTFSAQAFDAMPRFRAAASGGEWDWNALAALLAWALALGWLGRRAAASLA